MLTEAPTTLTPPAVVLMLGFLVVTVRTFLAPFTLVQP